MGGGAELGPRLDRGREVRGVLRRWEFLPTPTIREGASQAAFGDARGPSVGRAFWDAVSTHPARTDHRVRSIRTDGGSTTDRLIHG
jgi:hypothetical protein